MCFEPVTATTAITMGMKLATAAVGFAGDAAAANQQQQTYEENKRNAAIAFEDTTAQLQLRMIQEDEAKTQKLQEANIENAELQATANAAAAGAGVSGISLDNIKAGVQRKISYKREYARRNFQNTVTQLRMEMKGAETTRDNQINSISKPTSPNILGYALQGVGGALTTMAQAQET